MRNNKDIILRRTFNTADSTRDTTWVASITDADTLRTHVSLETVRIGIRTFDGIITHYSYWYGYEDTDNSLL